MTGSAAVYISPSCPSGGQFYACNSTISRFAGCCTINACETGCPLQNLKPASFNASTFGLFPNQQCDATTQSQFYVCAETSPPFLGCCKSNPCLVADNGCPSSNLAAMVLDEGPGGDLFLQSVNQFVGEEPLLASGVSSLMPTTTIPVSSLAISMSVVTSIPMDTSIPTKSTEIPSLTSMNTPTFMSTSTPSSFIVTNGTANGSNSKMTKGVIAGTTVASVVLVSGLAAILFFVLKRKNIMNRKSQRFSRVTLRQPSLFLPMSQGSEAVTVLPGPLDGGDGYTPPSSRGAEGSSGYSTPTKRTMPPPNQAYQSKSMMQNVPSVGPVASVREVSEDFGPPPPIQPRSNRRPNPTSDMQTDRYYSSSPLPRTANTVNDSFTNSVFSSLPPIGPLPQPPTQSEPTSATNTTATTSWYNPRHSNVIQNQNHLSVPFPMPPSRTSANSISQQYPFSPQFLADNPIFGSSPSASGPNFGFPIILSTSPSPQPMQMPMQPTQDQFHRFSGPNQNLQFQGQLSTSPPLSSSPPMVFAVPSSPRQTVRSVRDSGGFGDGYTIRAVSLEPVPEEPGSGSNSGPRPNVSNSVRNSRMSTGLGLSGMRTSPGPQGGTMQQRRMSPLSNVQYPPRSPPENTFSQPGGNGNGNGRGYGSGYGIIPNNGGNNNRRSRNVPLINYAGYNNGNYMEDYRDVGSPY